MFCTQCGNKMNDSDRFCSSCGAKNDIEKSVEAEKQAVDPVVEPVEEKVETTDKSMQTVEDSKAIEDIKDLESVEDSAADQEVASFEDLLKGIVSDNDSKPSEASDKLIDTDTKIFESTANENTEVADKLTELIENQDFENQAHEMELARELFFDDDSEVSKEDLDEDFYSPIEEETKKERKERIRREDRIRKGKNPDKSAGKVVLKILLSLLIIVLLVEVAVIGIKILSPTSKAGEMVDKYITKTIDFFKGSSSDEDSTSDDSSVDEENVDEELDVRHQPEEDLGQIIKDKEDLNYAKTIGAIEYSSNLKFKENFTYDNKDISKSESISENLWYSEGDEHFYYDESAVENIINYEVQRLNLINNQDDTVLRMVKSNSELYKALENSKGSIKEEMSKLLIGDIKVYNDYVFVWVKEEIETTHNGNSRNRERQRVYYMKYSSNHVVKIEGFEDI